MREQREDARKDERKALIFALVAVMLWSSVATGFKLGLELMTPLQLLFAGSCISTIVFVILVRDRRRQSSSGDGIN